MRYKALAKQKCSTENNDLLVFIYTLVHYTGCQEKSTPLIEILVGITLNIQLEGTFWTCCIASS